MGGIRSGLGGLGKSLAPIRAIGAAAFLGIGAAAVGGFGVAMGAAINMNATLETSTLQFETLMGDADRASEHVKGLFDFAAKTPFETGPIIEASRLMQVFGGDALNTRENLTLVGDTAAAIGAPLEDIGFWVGRAYAAIQGGQPFGEAAQNLMQLGAVSPDVIARMNEMKESGASADEIFGVLQEHMGTFSGAMEKQAGTWGGMMSTLKDSLQMAAAEGLKPFFDLAKSGLSWLNESGIIPRVGEVFSNFIKLIATAPGEGGPLMDYLQKLPTWLQPIGAFLANAAVAVSGFFSNLQEGMSPLDAFIEAIWDMAPQPVLDALIALRDDVLPRLTGLFERFVQPIIDAAIRFVSLKDVLIGVGVALAATFLPAIISAIAGVVAALAPFFLVIAAVAAVVALVRNAWENNWGGIQEKVAAVIGFIVPLIQNALIAIQTWWATNGATILAKAQEIFGGIQTVVQNVIGAVITWWNTNWPTIQTTIQTVWGLIQTVIGTAVEVIRPAIEKIVTVAQGAGTKLQELAVPLQELWAKVGPFVQAAATVIGGILTALVGVIVGIVNGIANALEPLIRTFVNVAQNIIRIVGGILDFFTGFFNLLVGLVTGDSEKIKGAFDKMGQGIKDIVGGLVEGVWELFSGLVETVATLIDGFITGIVEFFQNLYDELVGHSIVVDLIEDIVEWFEKLIEWIGDALEQLWKTVSQPFIDMWNDLKAWFAEKVEEAVQLGKDIVGGIVRGLQAVGHMIVQTIMNFIQQAWDRVLDFLGIESPSRAMYWVGLMFGQGLIDGIRAKQTEVSQVIDDMFSMLGNLSNLGSGFGDLFAAQNVAPIQGLLEDITGQVGTYTTAIQDMMNNLGLGAFNPDTPGVLVALQNILNDPNASFIEKNAASAAIAMLEERQELMLQQVGIQQQLEEQQNRLLRLEMQRQQLNFLQQQFDLLKLIRDNGLDVGLLEGLTFGADADPGALMDAMIGAMTQMIGQTTNELMSIAPTPPPRSRSLANDFFQDAAMTAGGRGGGTVVVNIDARGAGQGVERDLRDMIREVLDEYGARADIRMRTT